MADEHDICKHPVFLQAQSFLSSPAADATQFKMHVVFSVSAKGLKRPTPFDRWEVTVEKYQERNIVCDRMAKGSQDEAVIGKKSAIFLRSVLSLSHSTSSYQFANSLKGYV